MDDKTAELRDIFVEATGEERVTEDQTAARGSLSTADDADVDERLSEIVASMAERYKFASSLSEADLCRVARGFFDPEMEGADDGSWSAAADAAIAPSLSADADADEVFRARMDLHLVADADRDAPFPYDEFRERALDVARSVDGPAEPSEAGESLAADLDGSLAPDPDESLAADLDESLATDLDADVDPETVRRYRRVVEADLASRGVNHRFRDAFAELLTDADLSTRLASDARRDGLEEATEDIETDVSL